MTIDVFLGDETAFPSVKVRLQTAWVAALFHADEASVWRFDIADLYVIKFSIPRPVVKGSRWDRDMHGGQWGCLPEEMVI